MKFHFDAIKMPYFMVDESGLNAAIEYVNTGNRISYCAHRVRSRPMPM